MMVPRLRAPHAAQRRHRAMHLAEIGNLRAAREFFRGQRGHGREDRRHRIVDPDIDRPERRSIVSAACSTARRPPHRLTPRRRARFIASTAATAASSRRWPRAMMPTFHPACVNASTVARPTPALPPVTTTIIALITRLAMTACGSGRPSGRQAPVSSAMDSPRRRWETPTHHRSKDWEYPSSGNSYPQRWCANRRPSAPCHSCGRCRRSAPRCRGSRSPPTPAS